MKKCSKCQQVKPLTEFAKRPERPIGVRSRCRECGNEDRRQYRIDHPGKDAAYLRGRFEQNREMIKLSRSGEYAKYRAQNRARRAVMRAVNRGQMVREPCEVCGHEPAEGHHDSYAPEARMKVRWLCRQHHVDHHRLERETRIKVIRLLRSRSLPPLHRAEKRHRHPR